MSAVSLKTWVIVVGSIVVILLIAGGVAVYLVARSGFNRPFDAAFGDQHLKTTVALVELHRTRFGSYPANLSELRFTGDWDGIALQSVRYCAAGDRQSYFVEITRGWVGKPTLTMPPEFWQGTGYRRELGPCR